jgi:hypothetical protein
LERPSNFFDARQLLCQYRNMIISLMPAHRWPQCLGSSLIRFGEYPEHDWINRQPRQWYNRISLFYRWLWLYFSYARKLAVPGFQYGVNAKIIRRVIGNLPILGASVSMWDYSSEKWLAVWRWFHEAAHEKTHKEHH